MFDMNISREKECHPTDVSENRSRLNVTLLTDGDDTYPAEYAREMTNKVLEKNVDMVVGDRLSSTYFEETNGLSTTWEIPLFASPLTFYLKAKSKIL